MSTPNGNWKNKPYHKYSKPEDHVIAKSKFINTHTYIYISKCISAFRYMHFWLITFNSLVRVNPIEFKTKYVPTLTTQWWMNIYWLFEKRIIAGCLWMKLVTCSWVYSHISMFNILMIQTRQKEKFVFGQRFC